MLDHIPHRIFMPLFWLIYLAWMLLITFACWFSGGCPDFGATISEEWFDFSDAVAVTMALWITIEVVNRVKDWWLEESEQ